MLTIKMIFWRWMVVLGATIEGLIGVCTLGLCYPRTYLTWRADRYREIIHGRMAVRLAKKHMDYE